jgi:hypothetical protein
MVAASAVTAFLFYLWEARRERLNQPQLLTAHLLRNGNFLLGALVATLFFSAIPGFFMVLAIFLQGGFGFTPLQSGVTTLPFSLGVLVTSIFASRFSSGHLRTRLGTGALILALGMIGTRWVYSGITDEVYHWWFALPLAVSGVGLGIGISALFQTVLASVPPQDAGAGSGALQAFQQAGGALGVAVIGQIFFSTLESSFKAGPADMHAPFVEAALPSMLFVIGVFLAVAALTPFLKGRATVAPVGHGTPVLSE